MNSRYLSISLAVIAALAASCAEKEVTPPEPLGPVSIQAEIAPLSTMPLVWEDGDKIAVFSEEEGPVAFSLSSAPGKAAATFSGDLNDVKAGAPVFAVHPQMEGITKTAIPLNMARQAGRPGAIAPADVTVASSTFSEGAVAAELSFEHILGGVSFSLENQNFYPQTVTSVGIISDGIVMAGSYNLVSGELSTDEAVKGRSTLSLENEAVAAKSKSTWVLSMIPQTLPEGSKAFLELTPGDTLFKTLSRTPVKKDKLLEAAFVAEFEGLSIQSVMNPFKDVKDASKTLVPTWAPADKYGVFSGEKNFNVSFSIDGESGSETAVFTGYPDLYLGDAVQAYYPYTKEMGQDGSIVFDLHNQDVTSSYLMAPSDIAVAQGTVAMESSLTFSHVLAGVAFEVTNTSDAYPVIIASVGLSSGSISLTGSYNVLTGALKADDPAEDVVFCNTAKTLAAGETGTFFVSVPPQALAMGTVFSATSVTGETVTATLEEAVTVQAGTFLSVSLDIEGERGGAIHDLGACIYDTEGSVQWTSPALSLDGKTAYVTSSNYKLAAISLVGDNLSETPDWVTDGKEAGMTAQTSIVTATPSVSSTGIYALMGKGTYASLVKFLPDGTLDYYRWVSYYKNGNYEDPDPATTEFEFNMESPIIFPTSDAYKERVMFSIQSNGDHKRFVTARGCGNPSGDDDNKKGGARQASKGTTTNLGSVLGYVVSGSKWMFIAGRTASSTAGGQVIQTSGQGGSMSGDSQKGHMLGYIAATETVANNRGAQMSQDANYVYYMGWNPSTESYPNGSTLLFRYAKSNIAANSSITPDYIVALPGGVSPAASSGMRGVGSVLSADGSVIYVTTCKVTDGESAYVHAVNTADGSIIWSREAGDIYGLAAVDDLGNIYFNDCENGKLVQLDPQTGAVTEEIPLGTAKSSPTIGPGGIIWCNTLNADGKPTLRAFSISGANGPAKGWSQLGGNPQKSGIAY